MELIQNKIINEFDFRWTLPIFWGGLKKEMEERDLYEPLEEHASSKYLKTLHSAIV